MFEHAVLEARAQRQPWTVSASLLGQAAAVTSVVLASIWFVEPLPPVPALRPRPPLPHMKVVDVVRTTAAATSVRTTAPLFQPRVFTAPPRIPTSIAVIQDDMPASPPGIDEALFAQAPGAPGGLPRSGGAVLPTVPPPPPAPRQVPTPAVTQTRIRVGGAVQAARMVKQVMPVYPPLARQARISGVVRLEGIIGTDGRIRDLQMLSGHPLLVQAALEAVRQWVYRPTLLNGLAVEVVSPIEVRFSLGGQ